ncbi:tyrosine-type recombinase/integrase [Clostridium diolis]|uniref:tyrosine-type recombinase/integrase n=1 Tax=Clostridium diolis TaxID=223919 RepID=UPI003AF4FB6B
MASKTNYTMNGKEYFRISASFGRDSNGKLIRKFFYGKNKKEAEKKLDEYRDSLKQGLIPDKNIFLYPLMETWLFEIIRNGIKPTTFDTYEDIFRNYIKTAPFAYKVLKDIKAIEIQKYYNSLKSIGKSTSRINYLNKLLKQFMVYAVNEGYILRNPCAKIVIPGKNEEIKKEVEVFPKEDLIKILECKENSMIRDLTLICLSTGMRRGEALGLNWDDVDYINNEIHIKRNIGTTTIIYENRRKKEQLILTPKTKSSYRTIPLPESLIPVFNCLKKRQNEDILKAGQSYNQEYKGFIFLTASGNLINTSNITKSWNLFLKRIGVDYKKFHTLRHTYATLQFEANIPVKTVSTLLGHSKIDITANTYTHVLKHQKEKAIDIINVLKMC